ncbi:DUF4440 domain-containing protein [Pseudofrankia sp. EUN1h]|nr:DUF4440 domain-containing protein [Pseudofrankia sp. EUN1h]
MSDDLPGTGTTADHEAIAGIVRTFFGAFTSGPGCAGRLDELRMLFLPDAVIVRTCGREPAVYDVESFIAPRRELLTGGTLIDFTEWELRGQTFVFGDIAQHLGSYAKAGVQDGTPFTARGMKTLQLVRTTGGWRISAVAWDDERDGVTVEPAWAASARFRASIS